MSKGQKRARVKSLRPNLEVPKRPKRQVPNFLWALIKCGIPEGCKISRDGPWFHVSAEAESLQN